MAASFFIGRVAPCFTAALTSCRPLRALCSSHVIPTGACAVAWNLWLRLLFLCAGVPLCFTTCLTSCRPYGAWPQQPCHSCGDMWGGKEIEDSTKSIYGCVFVLCRQGCAALHRCLDVGSPLQGSATAVMLSLRVCSSHVIPAWACAVAWKSKIRRSQSMAASYIA